MARTQEDPARVPDVRFSQLVAARELLQHGGEVPDELRPAVREIVGRAARRRWLGAAYAVAGVGSLLVAALATPHSGVRWVFGALVSAMAVISFWGPQRTLVRARRLGLGPPTRYGWPR